MSSTGSAVAQRPPAPRNGESSYSRQQPVANQPDLSGRLVYADPRSLPSFPSVGIRLDCTNTAALMAATSKSPPPIFDVSGPTNPASLKAATTAAAASAALKSARSANTKPAVTVDVPEASQPKSAIQASPTSSTSPREPPSFPMAAGIKAPATASSSSMAAKPSPAPTLGWGNSAATQAFRNSQILSTKQASAPSERPSPEITALGHQPSLRAAKDAMRSATNPNRMSLAAGSPTATSVPPSNETLVSGVAAAGATGAVSGNTLMPRTRHRSQSTPLTLRQQKGLSSPYPDSTASLYQSGNPPDPKTSAANALSAATAAHTKSMSGSDRRSYVGDAGAVPYTNMGRQMYTSHPSIGPEYDSKKHQDGLHASAVAMAKQMYNLSGESGGSNAKVPNVQEQAYRLAQERLDKIYEQHDRDRSFRDHYVDPKMGADSNAGNTLHRLSMRSRLRRRRTSSDSDIDLDRIRSMEIRNQMSVLSDRISEVSQDKRRQDRQSVLLAAQRNVKLQLQGIDEKVYANSGRLPPSKTSPLDQEKINTIAQARADAHLGTFPRSDQVDIGGGKFIDRAEVDKIASRRMQPLIDDIHAKAQQEIERKAKLREEEEQRKAQLLQKEEERKAEAADLKARDKEMKELYRQLKKDEKLRKAEAKAAEKQAKRSGKTSDLTKDNEQSQGEAKAEPVAEMEMSRPDISMGESSTKKRDETALGTSQISAAKSTATSASASTKSLDSTNAISTAVATSAKSVEAQPSIGTASDSKSGIDDHHERLAETADGGSASRKLSKLFAKSPKEKTGRNRSVSNANGPGQFPGTTVAGAPTKSAAPNANGPQSPAALADKASTPQSPLSPLSDNESSSPTSNKVKFWFKSHFTRDRSRSSASATSAPSAAVLGKTAPSSGAVAAGSSTSGPSKAADLTTLSDHQSIAEKSFVGGHALTGAESPTPQGRGSVPYGSTSLASTLKSGGAIGTAGNFSDKAVVGNAPRDNVALTPEHSYTPTGSDVHGKQQQLSSPVVSAGENASLGGTQQTVTPEVAKGEPAGTATAKDVTGEDVTSPAQHASSPGPISGGQSSTTTSLGLGSPTPDAPGTAGTVSAENDSSSAGTAINRGPGLEHALPGNRGSYTSSQYSADAVVPGATGSGFGVVGANIFANISSTLPAEKSDNGNTFVSVLPPASTTLGTTSESGELTPPKAIRDPAKKKSASPVRDSRFLENLEDLP
ncbi:Eisosome assembly protein [Sporothrix epigloea]|uniref:Eisosome assembly protein n=1 Tax=Sporothrix epigloea TaxID=1892477 RepID=A0ABP0DUP3_9PEZI